ncbi:hypothetical protein [Microcoleus vaginatus]|uniref:hypothetical protein n=1 Tax=Microcoleus vaginatus TaxID=119532 RepID=UPI001F6230CA
MCKRTLANLSKLPHDVIEGRRILLKGGSAIARLESAFEIERSLPHRHVAAVLAMLKNIGLENAAGCPIAVEVFEGNVNDAKTLSPILEKVRTRLGIQRPTAGSIMRSTTKKSSPMC